jgi:hypothetical protein
MPIRRFVALPALLAMLACASWLRAEDPTSRPSTQPIVPDTFMRFVDDGKGGGSFQTAEVILKNPAGVEVHLVAAVHIGEKGYYDMLNQHFTTFDAVLYEMVKSKDMAPPAPGEAATRQSTSGIGEFQRFLKTALDLDFQLDDIDYTQANLVHADLDRETFDQMQEARGESFETIMFQQLLTALANPPKDENDEQSMEDMVNILTRPDMERQIKVVLARQLGDLDSTAMGLDGPNGSVIVTERNKAAMEVFQQSMDAGKKKIAIFYGAAHMPDMTRRLEEMGFTPVQTHWNLAWDLTIRADQPSAMGRLLDKLFAPPTTEKD